MAGQYLTYYLKSVLFCSAVYYGLGFVIGNGNNSVLGAFGFGFFFSIYNLFVFHNAVKEIGLAPEEVPFFPQSLRKGILLPENISIDQFKKVIDRINPEVRKQIEKMPDSGGYVIEVQKAITPYQLELKPVGNFLRLKPKAKWYTTINEMKDAIRFIKEVERKVQR